VQPAMPSPTMRISVEVVFAFSIQDWPLGCRREYSWLVLLSHNLPPALPQAQAPTSTAKNAKVAESRCVVIRSW
jgi:hypothetical protein